jgi:hypothetical protein
MYAENVPNVDPLLQISDPDGTSFEVDVVAGKMQGARVNYCSTNLIEYVEKYHLDLLS